VSASYDVFSALASYLWTKQFDFGFGVRLKLMHLTIMGAATLVLGMIILTFSRQVFPFMQEKTFCCNAPSAKTNGRQAEQADGLNAPTAVNSSNRQ